MRRCSSPATLAASGASLDAGRAAGRWQGHGQGNESHSTTSSAISCNAAQCSEAEHAWRMTQVPPAAASNDRTHLTMSESSATLSRAITPSAMCCMRARSLAENSAAGTLTAFGTVYAAHALYGMIGSTVAFVLRS